MVCTCGHLHEEHLSGRDYGYHNWMCNAHGCNCESYLGTRQMVRQAREGSLVTLDRIQQFEELTGKKFDDVINMKVKGDT